MADDNIYYDAKLVMLGPPPPALYSRHSIVVPKGSVVNIVVCLQ